MHALQKLFEEHCGPRVIKVRRGTDKTPKAWAKAKARRKIAKASRQRNRDR